MTSGEAALSGAALIAAGIAMLAWGYRLRGTWLEGDKPPAEGRYSVHRPPSAPGIKRIVSGVALIVLGAMLLARAGS